MFNDSSKELYVMWTVGERILGLELEGQLGYSP